MSCIFLQGEQHLSNVGNLQSLVIDEADRMIQEGHYQELSYIVDKINNSCEDIKPIINTIILQARDFYEVIFDEDKARINYHFIEIGSKSSNCSR